MLMPFASLFYLCFALSTVTAYSKEARASLEKDIQTMAQKLQDGQVFFLPKTDIVFDAATVQNELSDLAYIASPAAQMTHDYESLESINNRLNFIKDLQVAGVSDSMIYREDCEKKRVELGSWLSDPQFGHCLELIEEIHQELSCFLDKNRESVFVESLFVEAHWLLYKCKIIEVIYTEMYLEKRDRAASCNIPRYLKKLRLVKQSHSSQLAAVVYKQFERLLNIAHRCMSGTGDQHCGKELFDTIEKIQQDAVILERYS